MVDVGNDLTLLIGLDCCLNEHVQPLYENIGEIFQHYHHLNENVDGYVKD